MKTQLGGEQSLAEMDVGLAISAVCNSAVRHVYTCVWFYICCCVGKVCENRSMCMGIQLSMSVRMQVFYMWLHLIRTQHV